MTLQVPRLPFSLDPLIAEAKRRMKQRRLLVAALVVLVGGAVGATIGLRGPGGAGHVANQTPSQRLVQQLRYPAAWKRLDWTCWNGPPGPFLMLTTATPTPSCGNRFPAPEHLGPDGVAVWLAYQLRVLPRTRLRVHPGLLGSQWVTCRGKAAPGRPLSARIPDTSDYGILMGAIVCGPDYAKGEAAVRQMLASIDPTG